MRFNKLEVIDIGFQICKSNCLLERMSSELSVLPFIREQPIWRQEESMQQLDYSDSDLGKSSVMEQKFRVFELV